MCGQWTVGPIYKSGTMTESTLITNTQGGDPAYESFSISIDSEGTSEVESVGESSYEVLVELQDYTGYSRSWTLEIRINFLCPT